MKRTNTRNGFTLVELLIVLSVIGILLAIMVPNLMNARESARQNAAKNHATTVSSGLVSALAVFAPDTAAQVIAALPALASRPAGVPTVAKACASETRILRTGGVYSVQTSYTTGLGWKAAPSYVGCAVIDAFRLDATQSPQRLNVYTWTDNGAKGVYLSQ